MTRPFDKHLDGDELGGLISSSSTSASDSRRPAHDDFEEARGHVANCQDCAKKVQMHDRVQNEMHSLAARTQQPPGSDCFPTGEWIKVAAGLLPERETKERLRHAAQCDHCGHLLQSAAVTLSDEASAEELETLASLDSAQPDWQISMAETLQSVASVGNAQKARLSWPKWSYSSWRLAFTMGGGLALVVLSWTGLRVLRQPNAEQLLAKAYSDHRTIEVRFRGAQFAPVIHDEQRGAESDFDKPPDLLNAEAEIRKELSKDPNAPNWLDAKSRAELLDGHPDLAIQSLQRALETNPDSVDLLTDLGSAYFVRASSKDSAVDYGEAIESFTQALAKSPDDPIALYNRAIACERLPVPHQAIEDWKHYLRVDPSGDWAEDARRQLTALEQKIGTREKSLFEPLLSPEEVSSASDEILHNKVEPRFEEYLRRAEENWLPKAFPGQGITPSNEARSALETLAKIANEQHQDTWLSDLLAHTSGAGFQKAIAAFALSVQHNVNGEYAQGRDSAQSAAESFRMAANPAGELGAKTEQIYSEHLLFEGDPCMSLLRSINEPLEHSSYRWLQAQASLEESNCADLIGNPLTYKKAIQRGMDEAKAYDYNDLYLRGVGFQSLAATASGNTAAAFQTAATGLKAFWFGDGDLKNGEGSLMNGYNFYTDLDAASDVRRLSDLQVILSREATYLIDHHTDVVLRAMAHRWYSNAAYKANMLRLAADEYSRASALFTAGPDPAAVTRDRLDADILLAEIQTQRGDLEQAALTLQSVKANLGANPSFNPEILLYNAQADLYMKEEDSSEAESALRSAIFLSEWGLRAFPSESDRRSWAEQASNVYRNAVEWKLRSGDPIGALEFWEWYRGAELRAAEDASRPLGGDLDSANPPDPRNAPPLPAPDVVSSQLTYLRDQTNITYGVFPDGIAIWVFDDRGVYSHWIPTPMPVVQELTAQFERLCSDPSSDLTALRSNARALYDILIAPVEYRLEGGRTLMIEPDGFLNSVPWEALVDRGGHYLIEHGAITVTPGMYRAMDLRRGGSITVQSPALVISVPVVPEDDLPPLVDADTEANSVASRFESARLLRGSDATLSTVRREVRSATVLHFAGHALSSSFRNGLVLAEIDPRTERSRLITAGSFDSNDIGRLQLAVLSACHTADGIDAATPGTEDLVESLLHANVPHVIASRWNVDSRQTARLMTDFYTRLLSGDTVANSLRNAELTLASLPGSAHPYYWSAFELEGLR